MYKSNKKNIFILFHYYLGVLFFWKHIKKKIKKNIEGFFKCLAYINFINFFFNLNLNLKWADPLI